MIFSMLYLSNNLKAKEKKKKKNININLAILPSHDNLLFVMGALILQRVQKCQVRQVTKDVVKSEV